MFSYVIEFLRCDYAGCNPSIFLNAIARFHWLSTGDVGHGSFGTGGLEKLPNFTVMYFLCVSLYIFINFT